MPDRLLRPRQHGQRDGEGERDQHAAEEALQRAQHDHLLQVAGECTGDRHHQEQHRVRQQIAAQREHRREEAGQRDDHDLRHQVGGRDPAAVIDAGADRALDVRQRRVGDLDVQHRDEGADDGADDREPDLRVGPRLWCGGDVGVPWRSASPRVSMVGSTDMPGRSRPAERTVVAQHDLHRDALHDLGEVAGGVVRRQQRELLAARRRDAVHHAVHRMIGEGIDRRYPPAGPGARR